MGTTLRQAIRNAGLFFDILISRDGIARRYKYTPSADEAMVDPGLRAKESWRRPDAAALAAASAGSRSYKAWKDIPGGYKWLHYFPVYDEAFKDIADAPARILEIGVGRGGSLRLWRRLFPKAVHVVGIDTRESCRRAQDPAQSIFVEIGAQQDVDFLAELVDKFGRFDVIIDDGSHMSSHQIASFNFLFKDGLAETGTYVIEDTHSAYHQTHRDRRSSIMDFAHACIDLMHRHHFDDPQVENFDLERGSEAHQATYLARTLASVKFFDSIIVFEKNAAKLPPVIQHL